MNIIYSMSFIVFCYSLSIPLINLNNFPFQLFQIIFYLRLIPSIFHCHCHNLLLIFYFQLFLQCLQNLFMSRVQQFPLITTILFTFFKHGQTIFIPCLNGGEAFGGLLVLFRDFLFVLVTLLKLFLFLELQDQGVTKIVLLKITFS